MTSKKEKLIREKDKRDAEFFISTLAPHQKEYSLLEYPRSNFYSSSQFVRYKSTPIGEWVACNKSPRRCKYRLFVLRCKYMDEKDFYGNVTSRCIWCNKEKEYKQIRYL